MAGTCHYKTKKCCAVTPRKEKFTTNDPKIKVTDKHCTKTPPNKKKKKQPHLNHHFKNAATGFTRFMRCTNLSSFIACKY